MSAARPQGAALGQLGRRLAAGACAALALLGAAGARAEGRSEGLEIHPSLRVRAVADDNVFLDADPTFDLGLWVLPRLELDYARGSLETGLDLAADLRRYRHEHSLDEEYLRLAGFAEADLLPGLRLRLSDAYVPVPRKLGLPEDESDNLLQTNRVEAELRYRRELPGASSAELGLRATQFSTRRFGATLDTDGDGVAEERDDLRGDYLEAALDLELRRSLGRRAFVYARGLVRERELDALPRADFRELSGLLGLRVRWPARLELDLGAGYGRLDFDVLDDSDRFLGLLRVRWSGPRGLTARLALENRFTAEASGVDFLESTARLGASKTLGRRMEASLDLALTRFENDASDVGANRFASAALRLKRQLTRHLQASVYYRHWRNAGDDSRDDFDQDRFMLELVHAR